MKIAEIMTKDPLTAGPDETIKEVILKMRKKECIRTPCYR